MQALVMKTNRAHRFGLALSVQWVAGSALALGSQVLDGPCDVNCDGPVNALDIEPFLDLLFDPSAAACSPCAGDVNGDGVFADSFDTQRDNTRGDGETLPGCIDVVTNEASTALL